MKTTKRSLRKLIDSILNENHNMGNVFDPDAVLENRYEDVVRIDLSGGKHSDSKSIGSGGFLSQPQGPGGALIHNTVIQEVNIEISGVNENDTIRIESNTPFAIEASGGPRENNAKEYSVNNEKRYSYRLAKEESGITKEWGYLAPDGKLRVNMFMQRHEGVQEVNISRILKYDFRDALPEEAYDSADKSEMENMNEGLSRGSLYRKRYRRY